MRITCLLQPAFYPLRLLRRTNIVNTGYLAGIRSLSCTSATMTKEVRDYGSWNNCLPSSFVTAGPFKGFAELKCTADGAIYLLKQSAKDGSRVLHRRSGPDAPWERPAVEGSVRNSVNAYGAAALWPLSADEFLYTSNGGVCWCRGAELVTFHRPQCVLGDPNAGGDLGFAVLEDRSVAPCRQSIVSFHFRRPGVLNTVADNFDFVGVPRVSPDGRRLLFMAWNDPNMASPPPEDMTRLQPWDATSLHMAELSEDGSVVRVEQVLPAQPCEHNFQAPVWASDGTSFYFLSDQDGFWAIYNYVLPSGSTWRVAGREGADLGDAMWIVGDAAFYGVGPRELVYSADGELFRLCLDSGDTSLLRLPEFCSFSCVNVTAQGEVHCLASGPAIGESWIHVDKLGTCTVRDSMITSKALRDLELGHYETIWFTVEDEGTSWQVQGFFYPPAGPAGAKPPCVLMAHGGPTARATPAFDRKKAFYQSRGFAVFDVNYRGSTGRGRRFRDALYGRFGDADVADVCAAAKALSGRADPDRLFLVGSSAGGYLLLRALARRPRLFRAAGCSYGFADVFALPSADHKFEYAYNFRLIAPESDKKTWAERNMLDKLALISTPVALFHGKQDPVVPFQQSEAVFEALQAQGVQSTLQLFEGEGHGFRRREVVEQVLDDTYAFFCAAMGVAPGEPFKAQI